MEILRQHNTLLKTLIFVGSFLVCAFMPLAAAFALTPEDMPNIGQNIPNNFEGVVYTLCVGIGGIFLWLGGALLDFAMQELVLEMGTRLTQGYGLAVDTLWVIIRDMFNVVFIFGIIYIGFKTILSADKFDTRKTLANLIIAALMINFSLFITKAIVDVSNAVASQIYENTVSKEEITRGGYAATGISEDRGISYSFMNLFRMTTYASTANLNEYESSHLGGRFIFFGITMMFVMLIAAFVFAAGAFLMIARFVGLIIFMIFSPAMFAGFVFPHKIFSEYMRAWWEKFLQYAFVAPAYLFMLYLSLYVLGSGIKLDKSTGGSFAAAFKGGSVGEGAFIIFLHFFVVAGFLVAALMVAQKMSIYGANGAMGMLKGAGKFVQGIPKSVGGYAAARTIGAGFRKWDEDMENKGVSRTSMRRSFASNIAGQKFGGKYSAKDYHSAGKEASRKKARYNQVGNVTNAITAGSVAASKLNEGGNISDADRMNLQNQVIAMEEQIGNATQDQLINILGDLDPNSDEYKTIVKAVSQDQYTKLLGAKEEDFDDGAKADLRKVRGEVVVDKITSKVDVEKDTGDGATKLQAAIKSHASADEMRSLGFETLKQNAEYIPHGKMEDLKKKLTETQYEQLDEARKTKLKELSDKHMSEIVRVVGGQKPKDIAELPEDLLKSPDIVKLLNSDVLEQIGKNNTVGPGTRQLIRDNVMLIGSGATDDAREYLSDPDRSKQYYGIYKGGSV